MPVAILQKDPLPAESRLSFCLKNIEVANGKLEELEEKTLPLLPLVPVMLVVLFGVIVSIDWVIGGERTNIISYNISFYLANAPLFTFFGMVVCVMLFAAYAVKLVQAFRRAGLKDDCSMYFFLITSAIVMVGFLLVGIFYCDTYFEDGTLVWDHNGSWRLAGHGIGALFAFFGLAVLCLGATVKLHNISPRSSNIMSAAYLYLGGLFSVLVFICAILNQVVWNLTGVANLHPKIYGQRKPNVTANYYFTDETPSDSSEKSVLLAKCSYAEFGIIFFALFAMLFVGVALERYGEKRSKDQIQQQKLLE